MSTPTGFLLEPPLYSQPSLPTVWLLVVLEMFLEVLLLLLSRVRQGKRTRSQRGPGGNGGQCPSSFFFPDALAVDSQYRLEVQGSVTVQERLCVSVPCAVFYPWNSQKQSDPAALRLFDFSS